MNRTAYRVLLGKIWENLKIQSSDDEIKFWKVRNEIFWKMQIVMQRSVSIHPKIWPKFSLGDVRDSSIHFKHPAGSTGCDCFHRVGSSGAMRRGEQRHGARGRGRGYARDTASRTRSRSRSPSSDNGTFTAEPIAWWLSVTRWDEEFGTCVAAAFLGFLCILTECFLEINFSI